MYTSKNKPSFDTFSNLNGSNKLKAEPNHDLTTAGLNAKLSWQKKNIAANFILKKFGYQPKNIFSSLGYIRDSLYITKSKLTDPGKFNWEK